MDVMQTISTASEALTVKRVFGDPIAQDGLTVIPVAKVGGGGGGGDGSGPEGQGEGSGSGFGVSAKPVGVFVIKGGDVSWQPSVDVNRAILGGQLVAIVALLTLRAILKARAKN